MFDQLVQLVVLFLVIFDPPASFAVFFTATSRMKPKERAQTALLAVFVAAGLSVGVLFLGPQLLYLFHTNLDDFRVAGGAVLAILGISMALGHPLTNIESMKNNSGRAIAAVIGTPLLTGPAAISSIIASVYDFGLLPTGAAIAIVLAFTGLLLLQSTRISRLTGTTGIQ